MTRKLRVGRGVIALLFAAALIASPVSASAEPASSADVTVKSASAVAAAPKPRAHRRHRRHRRHWRRWKPLDRTSDAYVCAHGDPTEYWTMRACDRKDWSATERANN